MEKVKRTLRTTFITQLAKKSHLNFADVQEKIEPAAAKNFMDIMVQENACAKDGADLYTKSMEADYVVQSTTNLFTNSENESVNQ